MNDTLQTRVKEALEVVTGILWGETEAEDGGIDIDNLFMAQGMLAEATRAQTAYLLGDDGDGLLSFLDEDCECENCKQARVD